MRTRLLPSSLLSLSLVLAVPAAMTAQEAPAEPGDVTAITGTVSGEAAKVSHPHEELVAPGMFEMQGLEFIGLPIEASDPRLTGQLALHANGAGQEFTNGFAAVESRTYRLENADGAWAGSGSRVFAFGDDGPLMDRDSMTLVGEGDFEGLLAHVAIDWTEASPTIEGIIVEGQLPPQPDALAAGLSGDLPAFSGTEAIDTFLSATVGDRPGGISALVAHDGEVTISSVGAANAAGDPMTTDAAFRVGSISKTFLATMVLQLADEGLLDLDAPLSAYLPQTRIGGDVTVRQLLSHRSGIPNYTEQPGFFDGLYADLERSLSIDQIIDVALDLPAAEPDAEYYYSNTNYILLGQLLEAIGGQELDDALQARIAEPLGLESTTYDVDGSRVPNTLTGGWAGEHFSGDPSTPFEAISSSAWAAGSLVSTPEDLAKFLTALYDGQLISEAALEQMLDVGPEGYGLGIGTMPPGSEPGGYYGHGGAIDGYLSFMAGDPETGDIVIVLSNDMTVDPEWAASEIIDGLADTAG